MPLTSGSRLGLTKSLRRSAGAVSAVRLKLNEISASQQRRHGEPVKIVPLARLFGILEGGFPLTMTLDQGIAAGEVARQMGSSARYLCAVRLGRRRIHDEFLLARMRPKSLCAVYINC